MSKFVPDTTAMEEVRELVTTVQAAADSILATGLRRRVVVKLLAWHSGVRIHDVESVLYGMESFDDLLDKDDEGDDG